MHDPPGIPDTLMAVYAMSASKAADGSSVEQLWLVGSGPPQYLVHVPPFCAALCNTASFKLSFI